MRLNLAVGTLAGVLSVAIAGCGGGGSSNAVAPVRTTGASGCAAPSSTASLYVSDLAVTGYRGTGTPSAGGWFTYPLSASGAPAPATNVVDTTLLLDGEIAVDPQGKVFEGLAHGNGADGIAEFCPLANTTDPAPIRAFSVPNLRSFVLDSQRNLYALTYDANAHTSQILAYGADPGTAAGIASPPPATPQRVIAGPNTGLTQDSGPLIAVSNSAIFVPNADQIFAFAPGANGNVSPSQTLTASSDVGLLQPGPLAHDAAGNVYVVYADGLGAFGFDYAPKTVAVYAPGQYATPSRTITGPDPVVAMAFDNAGRLYEIARGPDIPGQGGRLESTLAMDVFPPNASGTVTPTARYLLPEPYATSVSVTPGQMAIDAAGRVYIADSFGSNGVVVYDISGHFLGQIAPSSGALGIAKGLAIDPTSGALVVQSAKVGDLGLNALEYYPPGTVSTVPPARIIDDSQYVSTDVDTQPVAVDASGNVYVRADNFAPVEVTVVKYAAGSGPAAQPSSSFLDPLAYGDTSYNVHPLGLTLDGAGNVVVSSLFAHTAYAYAPGTSGNNAAPIGGYGSFSATLNPAWGGNVVTVDSRGTLYVANGTTASVLVYPPNATTPARTIVGTRTRIWWPWDIAVDDAGEIFVQTPDGILVFAPGASGDVAPARWLIAPSGHEFMSIAIGPGPATGTTGVARATSAAHAMAAASSGTGIPDPTAVKRAVDRFLARLCARHRAHGATNGGSFGSACPTGAHAR